MAADDTKGSFADEPKGMPGRYYVGDVSQYLRRASRGTAPMNEAEAAKRLLTLGQVALGANDYESAVDAYASLLKLEPNPTAFYNLGSLYARGLGVKQDYAEAARLFHQAELLGNAQAGKLCAKCMYDYLGQELSAKTSAEVYAAMAIFVLKVYPEAADQRAEVNRGLLVVASTHYNKGEYAEAAKVFRAAAEFCHDGYAQYYLAVLYNEGAGVSQNELAALYWIDCAADNGAADVAKDERDGMLEAFRQGLTPTEFAQTMAILADWCEEGTEDIPADPAKAERWRALA